MKSILVFILFAAMMCWFMFSPIYKHVLIVRQAVLQQEVDYLLEVGANGDHGYIDSAMIEQSKLRLAQIGLQPGSINYEVQAANGMSAISSVVPLPRGVGLSLTVSYPVDGLYAIDQLIGIAPPPPNARLRATGMKMSEYVP
ncbi:hypothetical protein Back11_59950 [Paenibacillus baekrokdamisoli]|uniref:Uncharacterized protein n=1 Tax=Paenibacillus baekrokdamisoli TaxID=1712516 RepID=A0A3G9J0F3_9BACL|nr:hypothetical protein [Paenibacillus baekrokdamisoli]MBB3071312.1 hypothetical protein [Paenibacillus baekrokdamisoli]BBH24650.1 hypothetical protein Back11_59950 [Paenibacillus baekrokdamisoli]